MRPESRAHDAGSQLLFEVRDVAEVTNRDRDAARHLPDEFMSLSGTPVSRLSRLVKRYWLASGAPARDELVHALLVLLRPLCKPGAVVTDEIRLACEETVNSWLTTQ